MRRLGTAALIIQTFGRSLAPISGSWLTMRISLPIPPLAAAPEIPLPLSLIAYHPIQPSAEQLVERLGDTSDWIEAIGCSPVFELVQINRSVAINVQLPHQVGDSELFSVHISLEDPEHGADLHANGAMGGSTREQW